MFYDPTVKRNEQGKLVIDKKIFGLSVGHQYSGHGEIKDDLCLPKKLYGMNPKNGRPVDQGEIKSERDRYELAKELGVLVEIAIPLPEARYKAYEPLVNQDPGTYMVYHNDCSKVLKTIGMGDTKISDIINPSSMKQPSFTKVATWMESFGMKGIDYKIVQGVSK